MLYPVELGVRRTPPIGAASRTSPGKPGSVGESQIMAADLLGRKPLNFPRLVLGVFKNDQ